MDEQLRKALGQEFYDSSEGHSEAEYRTWLEDCILCARVERDEARKEADEERDHSRQWLALKTAAESQRDEAHRKRDEWQSAYVTMEGLHDAKGKQIDGLQDLLKAERMLTDHRTKEAAQLEEDREYLGRERDKWKKLVEDAHLILDASDIPKAAGVSCDRKDCQSHLQHRTHTLVEQRDEARRERDALRDKNTEGT